MRKRTGIITSLLLLLGAFLAAPAHGKCCPLDRLEISGPQVDGTAVFTAEELDPRINPVEQGDVYWPFFNATVKGDDRPKGKLGPAYDITYVLENVDGEPIEAHELVYLEADPPVGFTPAGQTQDFDPDDGEVYPIDGGWRPFPERGANALLFMLNNPRMVKVTATDARATPWWRHPVVLLIAITGLIASLVSVMRRTRRIVS